MVQCFFSKNEQTNKYIYLHGYLIKKVSRISSYRNSTGLSPINYKLESKKLAIPRSSKASRIHTFSSIIKIISIVLWITLIDMQLIHSITFGFLSGFVASHILLWITKTKPKHFYLYNLNSLVESLIILIPIMLTIHPINLFSQKNIAPITFYSLVMAQAFYSILANQRLEKYKLYQYPKELDSFKQDGGVLGQHPVIDNIFGVILKIIYWVF